MKKITIEIYLKNDKKILKIIEKIAKTLDIKIGNHKKNIETIILREIRQVYKRKIKRVE